jgi:hypothetical protein
VCSTVLHQPVRAGGLALAYALATSTLVLVTFLVSNLVLSAVGAIGQVAEPASPGADPPAAVLLSSQRDDDAAKRCHRGERRHVEHRRGDADRCADHRRSATRPRP